MKKNKFWLIGLAIFLRVLVSMFLFHPDIKTYNFQTSFLKQGVTNIYPYLANHKSELPLKEEFVYFPLTYFTLGGYQALISTFLGTGLDNWLVDASSSSVVSNPNAFWYLLFLKLPLLALDIAIAFLLRKFFSDKENKNKAFTFWLFNPITIILIYAFSNIDLYPVFLTLVAFLFIRKKKLIPASVFLGLAAAFKMYPLLFLPFLFLKGRNLKEKIAVVLIPLLILLATLIPFWSQDFVQSALVSGLTTRIFAPGFMVGFGESIIIGLMLLGSLFFYGFIYDRKSKMLNYWVVLFLIVFSFAHYHISWLLWLAPFLVILSIKRPKLIWPLLIWFLLAVLIPVFYKDRAMTVSLFRLYSTWFDLLPTPFEIVSKFYDPYALQSALHSILAGGTFVISYKILSKNK